MCGKHQKEVDVIFSNESLKKYMSDGIPNSGEDESVEKKLERQWTAIGVLSQKDESFWSCS